MYEGNIDFNRLWFKLARVRVIGSQLHKQWCDWGEVNQSVVTMPTTSLLHVLCHRKFVTVRMDKYFLHKWHHVPCIMTSPIIPFLSILNIWRWRGGGGGGGGGVAALLLNLKFRSKIWPKPLPKLRALSISLNWPARPVILTMNN